MKLTNAIRDAFIRAVIDDVPQVDYDEKIRARVMEIAAFKLPKEVKKLWDNKELRGYVSLVQEYTGNRYIYVPGRSGEDIKFTPEEQQEISKLDELQNRQEEKIEDLRSKVRAIAYSVTTAKALLEQLPEFEKYLPKDAQAASRSVPAIANLMKDLVEAGWPDGGKKKVEEPVAA